MSLYNMLHGVNPLTSLLLGLLGTSPDAVPRFRDCYLTEDGEIAIHTRTGGGNRPYYENEESCRSNYPDYFKDEDPKQHPTGPWNADLRALPGYVRDEDDDFDSTYATFFYAPTDEVAPLIKSLQELVGSEAPGEKWRKLFADMQAGRDSPRVAHAMEVSKPLIDALNSMLKDVP